MSEPIPECQDFEAQLNQVKKITSEDRINSDTLSPFLTKARLAANQCYQACADIISADRIVADGTTGDTLGWTDIEIRLRDRNRALDGYARIARNLPFSQWAGGTLANHDNEIPLSQGLTKEFIFLNDRHTVRDHISVEYIELKKMQELKQDSITSTFHSYEIAESAIARALAFYWDDVIAWLSLTEDQETNWWKRNCLTIPPAKFGFDTGKDIGYSIIEGDPSRYIATKLRLILVRGQDAPKGFWIKDAFPSPM